MTEIKEVVTNTVADRWWSALTAAGDKVSLRNSALLVAKLKPAFKSKLPADAAALISDVSDTELAQIDVQLLFSQLLTQPNPTFLLVVTSFELVDDPAI